MAAPDTAAPSTSYTPVVTDLMRLVRVLFSPGAVFGEMKDKPTFWMPFLIVAILLGVVRFLMSPFSDKIRDVMMAQSGRSIPAAASGPAAQVIGVVFASIFMLLLFAVLAGVLYGLVAALGGEATYKRMLCVCVFTAPIEVIRQTLTYVVLSMRGVESVNSLADMWVSLGADLLLPGDAQTGMFLRVILSSIGPLQIWSAALTAVGVGTLAGLEKGKAWTAAIALWAMVTLVGAVLASVGMRFMGG